APVMLPRPPRSRLYPPPFLAGPWWAFGRDMVSIVGKAARGPSRHAGSSPATSPRTTASTANPCGPGLALTDWSPPATAPRLCGDPPTSLPEPAAHRRPVDTGPLRGLDLAHAALDGLD